ncbi:MAG: UDP-N-acetylmuramoyl-L-alanyl-D-glutamate--2,6-diaminopimelate ligase [Peptococcaceae bacterium]|nr:UDP-N-acetylmuramoyl-L-alanyl-D-glutamate--2,6-diaminopimelate ligase [Candidatus Syntrophopropionicum ammoniitolerans]
MFLQDVIDVVDVRDYAGDPATPIEGIAYDSRQVKPGFLFVAIEGFNTDGHSYINEAIRRGAVAVVIQHTTSVPAGIAWVRTDNSRQALALIAARFYSYPAGEMKMIGITGTNGKTTVSNLLTAVFRAAGLKCGLIGTIHNRIGEQILPVKHTTPESLDLQHLLAEMRSARVQVCVMEVSSHALALHRVDGCQFDGAVFTNLTQDHLDFHQDMAGYLAAKLKLFHGLPANGGTKKAACSIINTDDPRAGDFLQAAAGGPVYTYGVHTPADLQAENIEVKATGVNFTVGGKWGRLTLDLKITGLFNVYNALAAFAIAAAMGIPPDVIKDALENIAGVPGRFEQVDAGQNFTIFVDYAHTPDGLENVLKTARQLTRTQLITVFGCGGDRDRKKRPLMGRIAVEHSDYTIITSDNPRTEDPLGIIAEIEKGVKQVAAPEGYMVVPDRRQAIRLAVNRAKQDDVVVIAGKGHEAYQIIGKEKIPFDDRLEAAAALREPGGTGGQVPCPTESGRQKADGRK